jgi:FHA domain
MQCANGHDSVAIDYCDQCGVMIEGSALSPNPAPVLGAAALPASVMAAIPEPSGAPANNPSGPGAGVSKAAGADVATTAGTCPNCSGVKDGFSIFCEDCGYDFVTGIVPVNRNSPGTTSQTTPASSLAPGALSSLAQTTAVVTHQAGTWMIVVATDRAQFDRVGDATVVFPVGVPDRVVELTADRASIGRKSTSRNIHPDVDLSAAPEDVAVSRQHAEIVRATDGTFTVTDLGSSNGTFLNGSAAAMSPNTPMPLANGDSVSVGAWTTLTLVLP